MLWRAMLRGTASGLLANAAADAGLDASWFVITSRDMKRGDYGGAPEFRSTCEFKVEIEASANAPVGTSSGDIERAARTAALNKLDDLCELAQNALLGGQGFDVAIACTHDSATATPTSTTGLAPGMMLSGPGMSPRDPFVAIRTVNGDGTVTLSAPYAATTGTYLFNVGSFVALFEKIESVDTYPRGHAFDGGSFVFTTRATMRINGYVHEIFEPVRGPQLGGINLYVDSINIFDPNGDFTGQEPFTVAPAPRIAGPDGRPEIVAEIDTTS
jgi:hypothetical protein